MESKSEFLTLRGTCPDTRCQNTLNFFSTAKIVECSACGQKHVPDAVLGTHVVDKSEGLTSMVDDRLKTLGLPNKGSELVKVDGLSNFKCKLLSPFLTIYGMDKSGNAQFLSELGHKEILDCGSVLAKRAFMISEAHINIDGYGRDQSGSVEYLSGLLSMLEQCHGGEERIVPIHADGDGHCLVHAVSRALIGRELFWHSLRKNLQNHLKERLTSYKELFRDFHDEDEWPTIIEEADPYNSSGGITAGLGNIHIFALSNILHRPIMLFDSPQRMQNVADYSGLFVPIMVDSSECSNKSPICIAWSSQVHNHFVPLVPVEGRPLPHIPSDLIPNVWGVSSETAKDYLEYNDDGSLTVGRGKSLSLHYLLKLVAAMECMFVQHNQVTASLVEEFYHYIQYPKNNLIKPYQVTDLARSAVVENRLYRCLDCRGMQETCVANSMLKPGGKLYDLVVELYHFPKSNKQYTFDTFGISCLYDQSQDSLVVASCTCTRCGRKRTRLIDGNGNTQYHNGDPTDTPSVIPTRCNCMHKHYWDGKEYDNLPELVEMKISSGSKTVTVQIQWFYGDSDPQLNSRPSKEAEKIIQDHFNGKDDDGQLYKIQEILQMKQHNFLKLVTDCNENSATSLSFLLGDENSTTLPVKTGEACSEKKQGKDDPESTSESLGPLVDNHEKLVLNAKTIVSNSSETAQTLNESKDDNQSKESLNLSNGNVSIKLSMRNGRDRVIQVKQDMVLSDLKDLVLETFQIPHENQILKQGYPPKVISSQNYDTTLHLAAGDHIKVEEITKLTSSDFEGKVKDTDNLEDGFTWENKAKHPFSENDMVIKLREVKQDFEWSGLHSIWEYAISRPHLFLPDGVFYQQFQQDIGLVHGRHCKLPLLPNKNFRYNEHHDRVELCVEPLGGHYPVNSNITQIIEKLKIDNANRSVATSIQTSSVLKAESEETIVPFHPEKVAPGFSTIGHSPTKVTDEEISRQRKDILKVIRELDTQKTNNG